MIDFTEGTSAGHISVQHEGAVTANLQSLEQFSLRWALRQLADCEPGQ